MHRTSVGQNQESAEYRLIEIDIRCGKMHRTPVGQNCQNAPNPGGAN